MKFNFKIQQFQTDAVESVVNCFKGQPYQNALSYRRDIGTLKSAQTHFQTSFDNGIDEDRVTMQYTNDYDESGFKNDEIHITPDEILSNVKAVQRNNNLIESYELNKDMGDKCYSLDIEMETGTGKTYVYIKTMYELNKLYGWSKFVVVVPSIAIREGVKKSFEITQDHFMEYYHKKIRFFVYNSGNLSQLDSFSSNSGINVMIINMQAFNTVMDQDGKTKEARIFNTPRDEFGSRRPRDVIKANRPIVILDEPQKMGGQATQDAVKGLRPLFILNYSATHRDKHDLVYALDAVDAYNQKLVKKIEVKGIQVKNLSGTGHYLYLDDIIISPKDPPCARIEYEKGYESGIKREIRKFNVDDNLYELSNGLQQYEGYRVSEIDPVTGTVSFTNGVTIQKGEIVGDKNEKDIRRIQIRETIKSHLEKEEALFEKNIKTLSLFFIDEVSNYRKYDENGEEELGEYGEIFEDEYTKIVKELQTTLFNVDSPYHKFLRGTIDDDDDTNDKKERRIKVRDIHKGYFSIDKKGHAVNSIKNKGENISDDISAYDLIMKNKERLLSFDEPTRFIFSHSALREGWDNPNIFQICILKHSDSKSSKNNTITKRQEVGRGLRLCVDKEGYRMDEENLGADRVHEINKLTVIASESYQKFVEELQTEIIPTLYNRPQYASVEYFTGKTIKVDGKDVKIDHKLANQIHNYLLKNDYVPMDGTDKLTDTYHNDLKNGTLKMPSADLGLPASYDEGILKVIQSVFDESILRGMIEDGNKTKVKNDINNENFCKKEFQTLWNSINHKYTYTVKFDSDELIDNCIKAINDELLVSRLQYTTTVSEQKDKLTADDIKSGDSFKDVKSKTAVLKTYEISQVKYDLIGEIKKETNLTRKTIAAILGSKKLSGEKFNMFRNNPEEFISKVSKIINDQKANRIIIEGISYNVLEDKYDNSIFTADNHSFFDKNRVYNAKKHILKYVFTDGTAEKSVERRFAEELDAEEDVVVYAKLPRGFTIPTPMGKYNPDWAIAFKEGTVKYIYFVAETKGSMDSADLRSIEKHKIDCAKKLFEKLSADNINIKYGVVKDYNTLMSIVKSD